MTKLHLVRGLPGSGKSTFANNNRTEARVVEADQFFLNKGIYAWDPKLLHEAHAWCYGQTAMLLRQELNVVVANTFVTTDALLRYIKLRDKLPGLEITITELFTEFKSIHNVPREKVCKMAERWENIPADWTKLFSLTINRVE